MDLIQNRALWNNPERWESVKLPYRGYVGLAYDGRYVYESPLADGGSIYSKALRFDTIARNYSSLDSWEVFDLQNVAGCAGACLGYTGCVFDTRYVYFIPYHTQWVAHGLLIRFDSRLPFGSPSSYQMLDLAPLCDQCGFADAVFDGRFVYLSPNTFGTGFKSSGCSLAVRIDALAPFSLDAVQTTNISKLVLPENTPVGFRSMIFDGRYVYYIGFTTPGLLRFDASLGNFTASTERWTYVTLPGAGDRSSNACAFDGRFIYILPPAMSQVFRLDTRGAMHTSEFQIFSPAVSPGYFGAAYDGRFVYFAPEATLDGVLRYDTTKPFDLASSWDTAWGSGLVPRTASMRILNRSMLFDGRFMYMGTNSNGASRYDMVRFDTGAPLPGGNIVQLTAGPTGLSHATTAIHTPALRMKNGWLPSHTRQLQPLPLALTGIAQARQTWQEFA
eukprot:TRINITY_DN5951_c0_g2_i1.p1 TRINITY_DN5951_c0_g2~~TRINITY_DN5951_c0_g2_i1.p1  ORF type:complete len:446 (-),score=69.98 TRINITY_DN5951_c0_g2_i1:795-2132(-)